MPRDEIDGRPHCLHSQGRGIGAPSSVDVNGQTWVFDHWSDGGEQQHDITTPAEDAVYVARYRPLYVSHAVQALTAVADTFVNGSSPDTSCGDLEQLIIKTHPGESYQRDVYLKFDLSTIVDPIADAKLRPFGRLGTPLGQNVSANVYHAPGAQWYEIDLAEFLQAEQAKGRRMITLVVRGAENIPANIILDSREAGATGPQLKITV